MGNTIALIDVPPATRFLFYQRQSARISVPCLNVAVFGREVERNTPRGDCDGLLAEIPFGADEEGRL
jgi:hypothetical protein